MEQESSPVFKVSRVLWFPMSVNAVALGALCFILFWAWTFVSVAIVGRPDLDIASSCVSTFFPTLKGWVLSGLVPESLVTLDRYRWVFCVQSLGAYVLWAIGGVAIARVMAVRIARDEYITIRDAVAFAWSTRFTALLYAPAILLSMAFLWIAIFGIGLIGRIPWLGWALSAFFLPIVIFFTILVRILSFAGVLSMGMTAGAIACEKKGTWDSVAKAFNYLFARPLAVLLYVVLLWVFVGVVQDLLFGGPHLRDHVANLLVPFWKAPTYEKIARGAMTELSSGVEKAAAFLHAAVFWVIDAIIAGAILSWIVGAFTSMFLIFRKEIDGTEYTDIVKTPAESP